MGLFVVYVVGEEGDVVDGEGIGSARGWSDWADWAAGNLDPEEYPCTVRLAEEGEGYPVEDLAAELGELAGKADDRNVNGTTATLLAALDDRPDRTGGIIVSDGSPGAEDGAEDEDED
jgi:hypothetical protein